MNEARNKHILPALNVAHGVLVELWVPWLHKSPETWGLGGFEYCFELCIILQSCSNLMREENGTLLQSIFFSQRVDAGDLDHKGLRQGVALGDLVHQIPGCIARMEAHGT